MTIEVFILRHGIAAAREEWAPRSESHRPLTAKGEKQVRRIAKAIEKMELSFDLILTSPLSRARKTAEIVVARLGCDEKLKLSEALKPDASPKNFIDDARRLFGSSSRVLVVGHEPFLSGLISVLVRGDSQMQLNLKKAGLCKVTMDVLKPAGGTLEWLLTPGQMAEMA